MVGHPSQQGSLMSEPTTRTEIHKESSDQPDALSLIRWPGLRLTVSLAQVIAEGRAGGLGALVRPLEVGSSTLGKSPVRQI